MWVIFLTNLILKVASRESPHTHQMCVEDFIIPKNSEKSKNEI